MQSKRDSRGTGKDDERLCGESRWDGQDGTARLDDTGGTHDAQDAVTNGKGLEAREAKRYEHHYGGYVSQLTLEVEVGALLPWDERKMVAEYCIWDTGATDVSMNKTFADKMGIVPLPPMDDEMHPLTAVDANYLGTVTASLRIGDVFIPHDLIKVTDYDPTGRFAAMGYRVPDLLIGMSVISRGRFEVDCTGGETVVRFEMP